MIFSKVLKFEFKNILRSRWIFGYLLIAALLSGGFNYLSNDVNKVLVSLGLVLPVLVPMVSLTYSSLHWYYNERFTVLLLTQPISRTTVIVSRYLALSLALSLSVILGLALPFVFMFKFPGGLWLLFANIILLTFIFVGVALLISSLMVDRLKGLGLALGAWLYLNLIHDGLLLVLLIVLREFPMDMAAGLFSALNPISLSRVVQLMYFDQPLLLGHTGALTKLILTSWRGYGLAAACVLLWLVLPMLGVYRSFQKKNL